MYNLHDRILGSLVTAGMGDAIGAPGEALSRDEIFARFSGPITEFLPPTGNFYCEGNRTGEVTDDTTQLYEMANAVIETRGNLTTAAAADALLAWSRKYPRQYPRNAGPTMRGWIVDYEKGGDPVELGKVGCVYGRGISNGCAMRIAPAALCVPGDLDAAVRNAVTMTKVSHGTQHSYSGACAISCAISEALTENAQIHSIVKAAVWGAKEGERIGLNEARHAAGPRVLPRLIRAIECAYAADNAEDAAIRIADEIGCNGDIQPSVGVALGMFIAHDGDPVKTILGATNIGGDTDTFACIAGMIAGAYRGIQAIPTDWFSFFKAANPELDFEWQAAELTKIAENFLAGK